MHKVLFLFTNRVRASQKRSLPRFVFKTKTSIRRARSLISHLLATETFGACAKGVIYHLRALWGRGCQSRPGHQSVHMNTKIHTKGSIKSTHTTTVLGGSLSKAPDILRCGMRVRYIHRLNSSLESGSKAKSTLESPLSFAKSAISFIISFNRGINYQRQTWKPFETISVFTTLFLLCCTF